MKVEVDADWLADFVESTDTPCPFCGASPEERTVKPADELFRRRIGCLSCSRWLTPERPRVAAELREKDGR
jgi:hypothetical protein